MQARRQTRNQHVSEAHIVKTPSTKLLPAIDNATQNPSLHFSPPDGRSTRYDRQDFAFPSRRLLTVLNVLFKYACARQAALAFFLRPGLRLVLTALSPTSPRHVVRNAG